MSRVQDLSGLAAALPPADSVPPPLPLHGKRNNFIAFSDPHTALNGHGVSANTLFFDALADDGLFLTTTRQALLERYYHDVIALDVSSKNLNEQRLKACACSIIIAQRGYGKTFLLKSMITAARKITQRTLFCYLNYKLTHSNESPLQIIRTLILEGFNNDEDRAKVPMWKTLDDMCGWLERNDLRLVLFVDELENIFRKPRDIGGPIIAELVALAEPMGLPRNAMCFITSSASSILRLCFEKLTPAEATAYPSYIGVDFNYRKYACITLDPIHTRKELDHCLLHMGVSEAKRDEMDMGDLMVTSRGIAHAVRDIVYDADGGSTPLITYFSDCRRDDDRIRSVWYAIATLMRDTMGPLAFQTFSQRVVRDPLSETGPFTQFSISEVRGKLESMSKVPNIQAALGHAVIVPAADDDSWAWNIADRGFLSIAITFSDIRTFVVGFAHVSDFVWTMRNLTQPLGGLNGWIPAP